MIINIDETKKISFDINVQGAQYDDIKGALRIKTNNIEFGFPIEVNDGTVSVNIPPLNELLKNLDDGDVYKAKLEMVVSDQYIVPWEDDITIEKPVSISAEVKMEESIKDKKVLIGITKINEKCEKKSKKKESKEKIKKPKTKFGNKLLN
jgi:hypothetical protein